MVVAIAVPVGLVQDTSGGFIELGVIERNLPALPGESNDK
jgi:hypothetical protein